VQANKFILVYMDYIYRNKCACYCSKQYQTSSRSSWYF